MKLRLFSRYRHLMWITTLILVASGTLLLAACGSTSNTSASTPTATQQQGSTPTSTASSGGTTAQVDMVANNGVYAFSPDTLTIAKGTTVTWTNKSAASHTVVSDNNAFTASSLVMESETFQMTFTTAGTFTYHCSVHPYMKATITVTG